MVSGRPLTSSDGDDNTVTEITIEPEVIVETEIETVYVHRDTVIFDVNETLLLWWFIMSVLLLFIASIN